MIRIVLGFLVITLFFVSMHETVYGQASGSTTLSFDTGVTGQASVVGNLAKGSGSFVIDHPLDPKNKLLYHSFVESPDVKNIYDGIAELDGEGTVIIELPEYFLALNKDFRYLATPLEEPMPDLFLKRKVERSFFGLGPDIRFEISGGIPGGRVSWQVTGIRHDPFITANPIQPEVEKGPRALLNVGRCLFEPLCDE